MAPSLPGFAGSGNSIVGRPLARSPSTSTEAAPTSCVPPPQTTESVADELPPPQPASSVGRSSQATWRMRLPSSVSARREPDRDQSRSHMRVQDRPRLPTGVSACPWKYSKSRLVSYCDRSCARRRARNVRTAGSASRPIARRYARSAATASSSCASRSARAAQYGW